MELLFGPGIEPNHFNDDALGSTLDKIYAAGPKKVFSAVSLKAQPVKIVFIKEQSTAKRFLPDRFLELERAIKMLGFEMDIFIKP